MRNVCAAQTQSAHFAITNFISKIENCGSSQSARAQRVRIEVNWLNYCLPKVICVCVC